jgi:hypothetical protein
MERETVLAIYFLKMRLKVVDSTLDSGLLVDFFESRVPYTLALLIRGHIPGSVDRLPFRLSTRLLKKGTCHADPAGAGEASGVSH